MRFRTKATTKTRKHEKDKVQDNLRVFVFSWLHVSLAATATVLLAQTTPGVISGSVGPSPYDVVRGWHKPNSEPGYTFGGSSGVFAESPNRIFLAQRGEYKLPDGYLEVHTISVDSNGNLYGGDNQYGRTQKFVPKPGADTALLIATPWAAR
jgi:hypothetical protein